MMYLLLPVQSESQRERLALLPADDQADRLALAQALRQGGPEFVQFLLDFGLGALWHAALGRGGTQFELPETSARPLREARLAAGACYLAQRNSILEVDRLFERTGIPYAVMKGALVRERLHNDPAVMPAHDIDLLIAPGDRQKAAQVLAQAGYAMHLNPVNISHEILLRGQMADIDLHWHILRPGRTRINLTAELLSRRVRVDGFWGLCDSDSTFVMLTHPAFTKYVCSPHMGLGRVMGFLLWSRTASTHWPAVMTLLERTGLKTAAWAMLGWFIALAPSGLRPMLSQWREDVRPGPLRARYLDLWLQHNLPSRLIEHPLLIQAGMVPLLHDQPSGALFAYRAWYSSWRQRERDAGEFLALGEC